MSDQLKKIPAKIESFNQGSLPEVEVAEDGLQYEPQAGELIDVAYWCRFPSYDFIFGVPHKSNPKYAKEVGFFQYRNTKHKRTLMGFYVDCNELFELFKGFDSLLNMSKMMRPEMWQQHEKDRSTK